MTLIGPATPAGVSSELHTNNPQNVKSVRVIRVIGFRVGSCDFVDRATALRQQSPSLISCTATFFVLPLKYSRC